MRVAIVDGVRIEFYANDHPPPHFHALLAEHRAVIDIGSGEIVRGMLPVAKRRVVLAWASAHRSDLLDSWYAVRAKQKPKPIQ
ncbi:MAG: DUF4160 domain-containing protein [Rhizobiales bacterium]|nr:DUF4160 domain-containing protein [Hyphomicrobiales bacterium]